jgi:hypothetical protein
VALELTNWAGNLAYSADSVHYPTSVVEVQELVARLPRVKALGTVTRSTPLPMPRGVRSSGCPSWRQRPPSMPMR